MRRPKPTLGRSATGIYIYPYAHTWERLKMLIKYRRRQGREEKQAGSRGRWEDNFKMIF
jgi:hypothetical protein